MTAQDVHMSNPAGGYYPSQRKSLMMNRLKRFFGMITSPRFVSLLSLVGIIVLVVYLFIAPPYLSQLNINKQILDEISRLTSVNVFDNSTVFTTLLDADAIRKENAIQATVYKDAQNGDYVIGFSDKMIIYRRSTGKIIYDGKSPAQIAKENGETMAQKIGQKVYDAGLIPSGTEEIAVPQMVQVTDPSGYKAQDTDFYANLQEGDIIASFSDIKLVVIYRPASDSLINQGTFNTSIQTQ